MPPKKKSILGPTPEPTWSREVALQYTSFRVPPMVNAKNISGSYLKTDAQTWIARAAASMAPNASKQDGTAAGKKRKKGKGVGADSEEDEDEDAEEDRLGAANTLVIHPGSHSIRIGKALSFSPLSYPAILARRTAPPARSRLAEGFKSSLSADESSSKVNGHTAAAASANGAGENGEKAEDEIEEEAGETAEGAHWNDPKDDLGPKIDVLRTDLRAIMRSLKLRPVSNGRQLARGYNETAEPERVPEHADVQGHDWTDMAQDQIYVGEQALHLPCFSVPDGGKDENASSSRPWKIFRPFKRGMLNIDDYVEQYGPASAEMALLGDVQKMIEMILEAPRREDVEDSYTGLQGLGIPRSQWSSLNIVLVVPDLFSRSNLKSLAYLFLGTMCFSGLSFQNEGIASLFGAGISSACVVDIGYERTGITCVDEGLVVAESRIELNYGGHDISHFFQELLHRSAIPYQNLDIDKRIVDLQITEDLKERALTLLPSEMGLNFWDFQVRLPGKPTDAYKFRMYDEVIVAPLLLFAPRVVDFERKKGPRTPKRLTPLAKILEEGVEDPGEPTKDEDVAETTAMMRTIRHLIPAPEPVPVQEPPAQAETAANTSAEPAGAAGSTPVPAVTANGATRDSVPPAVGGTGTPANGTPQPQAAPAAPAAPASAAAPAPKTPAELGIDVRWESSKTPLDVAVWASIVGGTHGMSAIGTEERIKKMSQNVLCVGGSALVPGVGAALEARLNVHLDAYYSAQAASAGQPMGNVPNAQSIPPPRDMDPRQMAWKGSAVMARLTSVGDFLVRKEDWDLLGWRAVREKTLFL